MPDQPLPNAHLIQLVRTLGEIRDSWVTISLALTDLVTETPSIARDEVLIEVERHLSRIREGNRGSFD
jgi:hypothetical protein